MLGGDSAERPVSLRSGAAVMNALLNAGVDAHPFDPAERPLTMLKEEHFDRVFVALHGRGGEDGHLQGALEWMRLPYTGSGVLASSLGMDKWRSKLCWQAAGLPVPECAVLNAHPTLGDFNAIETRLGLPLFVKPVNEGSSIGVAKVTQPGQLRTAWEASLQHDKLVIAERFLSGGEFTVAILGDQALPVIRIVPQTEFYDYEAKYNRNDTEYRVPSGLSLEQESAMQHLALRAFDILGAQGWGRVDILQDAQGNPHCLEINTSPGMTDHSLVPMAARAAGLSFEELVVNILEGAHLD